MTLPVHYDVEGEAVRRVLTAVELAISDANLAAWLEAEAKPYVQRQTEGRFASEGDSVSGKWAALAESTIETRLAAGYGSGPILHRTGEMETYLTEGPVTIAAFPGGVVMDAPGGSTPDDLKMKIQTAQKGSSRTPARPVIGMGLADAESLTQALSLTLHEEITRGIL